jgi:hypothetical protein
MICPGRIGNSFPTKWPTIPPIPPHEQGTSFPGQRSISIGGADRRAYPHTNGRSSRSIGVAAALETHFADASTVKGDLGRIDRNQTVRDALATPSTMTIFSGDRVDTGADTAATIILAGRTLTLDRNSSAVFRNGTLVLSRGKAWLANQSGSALGAVTRLAAAPVTSASAVPLAAAETQVQGDSGSSNDHFTGTCKQFAKACDQAEDACEKKNHRECVCS